MLKWILLPVAGFAASAACANGIEHQDLIEQLSLQNMQSHITELASDEMEGRGAGSSGGRRAAHYIADQFGELGLISLYPESDASERYFQSFTFLADNNPLEPWIELTGTNVLAVIEGSSRPDEVVLVGGHFDGQGMEGQSTLGRERGSEDDPDDIIWNSASDNATSIAAMLEMARVLIETGYRPQRTIMFIAFDAEEVRLNGSNAYVADLPIATAQHIAFLNMEKLVGHGPSGFLTASRGSSPALVTAMERAHTITGMDVPSFYEGVIATTDTFGFHAVGIPAMTIGTGAVPNIHRNSDHASTLLYDHLIERTGYIFAALLALADSDIPAPFTGDFSEFSGAMGAAANNEELEVCNVAGPGFKITSVIPNTPADRAGLEPGNLVVQAHGEPVHLTDLTSLPLELRVDKIEGDLELTIACGEDRRQIVVDMASDQ